MQLLQFYGDESDSSQECALASVGALIIADAAGELTLIRKILEQVFKRE